MMKKYVVTLVMALVMALGCVGNAFAAEAVWLVMLTQSAYSVTILIFKLL